MAPEQIQGQKVDGRTDIYALGIVLYEMLVGWVPFSATTPVAALYKQVNESPPPLRQANINVPDWLEAIVMKALEKSPGERFQRASEFAEALRERRLPSKPRTPVPVERLRKGKPAPVESQRRSNLVPILLVGIVILLLALLGGGAFLVFGGGTGGGPTLTPLMIEVTKIITPTPMP
jgi:serine/threonine-protein kinase